LAGIFVTVDDCYDNAMCESFNATLDCELLFRHRFKTRAKNRSRSSSSSKALQPTPTPHVDRHALTFQVRMPD